MGKEGRCASVPHAFRGLRCSRRVLREVSERRSRCLRSACYSAAQVTWVIQRVIDDWYWNGFKRDPWSKSVVSALAYPSKCAAMLAMEDRGWRGVRYLLLPRVIESETPALCESPRLH